MWRIDGTIATWEERWHLDLARPAEGIRWLKDHSQDGPRLLKIVTRHPQPLVLVDSYVRGTDCIATYAPLPPDQVQPQIYWRGRPSSMEVMLSMQTSLLESDPLVDIVSNVPVGEQLSWCDPSWRPLDGRSSLPRDKGHSGLLLLRPTNGDWSYAEAVFPSDFVRSDLNITATTWSHPLFAERLEKGVIRRGRVACWLLPRAEDQKLALASWEAFCHSPPPLTA